MKRFMMVAMLLGALSLGACVDDTETQSVTDVRNAKAEQLKAAADLANAQAEAAKTQAEAQKALAEAQAAYQRAQAEAAKIAAEAEAALKKAEAAKLEADAAVAKAQAEKIAAEAAVQLAMAEQIAAQTEAEKALAEANLKKAMAEAEKAMANAQKAQALADAAKADAEAAKARAEANKKQAELDAARYVAQLEALKLQTEAEIARLEAEIAAVKAQIEDEKNELVQRRFYAYTSAIEELNRFKKDLIDRQLELAKAESGYATTEESNRKLIANEEKNIARYENEIEAYKEYKGYDYAQLWEQVDQLSKQLKMAEAEFETNPAGAAVVATNEPIEKAFNEVQKQTALVENVLNFNTQVLNADPDFRTIDLYRVVTLNQATVSGYLRGYVYTEVSVDEARKTEFENRLAHNIEDYAEQLGTPEDRFEKSTAYGWLAYAKKNYDRAVANLEQVKGEFAEVIEAYKKAEAAYFDAKDANDAARKAADAANKAANEAAEAVDKAQAAADKAAAELLEAASAWYAALQLPDTDPDKQKKVEAAQAAKDKATKADADAKANLKKAQDAKTAADKAAEAANKAAGEAREAFYKAQDAYDEARENHSEADAAVKNAENDVVAAQEQVSTRTNYLNSVQKNYDDAVAEQKAFAEALAALDIEAVHAAAAALAEAEALRAEAWAAFEEAQAPIEQIRQDYLVALDMWNNCSAIDVEKEISDRQQWIAESQEKIANIQAEMTNAEALNERLKAEIAELESRIEIQTGIVDKAKAALDAALAE